MSPRILVVDNDEMSVELLVALLADDYPLSRPSRNQTG